MKAFFDTNVIVYAHDRGAGRKQLRAIDLLDRHARAGTLVVSTQVLVESYNALQRAALLTREAALAVVEALTLATVMPANAAFVLRSLKLSQRFQLSHWDALVVQTAIDAGCTALYTEDLHAGQRFDEVEVVNPFADVAHESREAHAAAKPAPGKRTVSPQRRKR